LSDRWAGVEPDPGLADRRHLRSHFLATVDTDADRGERAARPVADVVQHVLIERLDPRVMSRLATCPAPPEVANRHAGQPDHMRSRLLADLDGRHDDIPTDGWDLRPRRGLRGHLAAPVFPGWLSNVACVRSWKSTSSQK